MSNYSDDPASVLVSFFKHDKHGQPYKWYCNEAVKWLSYDGKLIHDAFQEALEKHLDGRLRDMTAVCLEPYHEHSHPVVTTTPGTVLRA